MKRGRIIATVVALLLTTAMSCGATEFTFRHDFGGEDVIPPIYFVIATSLIPSLEPGYCLGEECVGYTGWLQHEITGDGRFSWAVGNLEFEQLASRLVDLENQFVWVGSNYGAVGNWEVVRIGQDLVGLAYQRLVRIDVEITNFVLGPTQGLPGGIKFDARVQFITAPIEPQGVVRQTIFPDGRITLHATVAGQHWPCKQRTWKDGRRVTTCRPPAD